MYFLDYLIGIIYKMCIVYTCIYKIHVLINFNSVLNSNLGFFLHIKIMKVFLEKLKGGLKNIYSINAVPA